MMKKRIKRISIKVLIAGLCFFVGYFGAFMLATHPLTEDEYEYCGQVAQSIYEQRDEYLIEIPDDVNYDKTDTEITVWKGLRAGKVIATLKNGELALERNAGVPKMIFFNILIGVLFVCAFGIVDSAIDGYKEKKTKKGEV